MRKKGRVWQLRVKNSPAEEAATGKRYTVHSLGRDTAKAIAQAEKIRRGTEGDYLDEMAEALALDQSDGADDVRLDFAHDLRDKVSEEEAVKWYRRASGKDADLRVLAQTNRDVISNKTYLVRIDLINRAGIRYISDVPDRQAAIALIDKMLASKVSRATVSLTVRTLNTIWRIAINKGILDKSPWERHGIRVPKTVKRALSADEFRAVVASAVGLERALVLLLGLTGNRIGAALGIRPEHVEGDLVKIVKDKVAAGRTVAFSATALSALEEVMKEQPTYDRAYALIMKGYDRIGIRDADAHSLRRTCAQALMDSDIFEHVASSMLGHSFRGSSMTFSKYATRGPSKQALRHAATTVERHLLGLELPL